MANAIDIVAYTYAADLYCPDCILTALGVSGNYPTTQYGIEEALDCALIEHFTELFDRGARRYDETSFDSGDFPKVAFRDQLEPGDRCGSCGEPLDRM